MLTHGELIVKCQELREAANLLMDTMHENDYNYNSYIVNLLDRESSLLSVFIMNRDNISDADAKEIINTITTSSDIVDLALGLKNTTESID